MQDTAGAKASGQQPGPRERRQLLQHPWVLERSWGAWGGGNTSIIQVTKEPQTFVVGGRGPRPSAHPGGSLKSGASPAPADQPLLSLLFKKKKKQRKKRKKRHFLEAASKGGLWPGGGGRGSLALPPGPARAPPNPRHHRCPHRGSQPHTSTGAGTPVPLGSASNGVGSSSPPHHHLGPHPGVFILTRRKKKVTLVQSKRRSGTGPTVPRAAQPCSDA